MTEKKQIAPRLLEGTAMFYRDKFSTATTGAEYTLESCPIVWRKSLAELRGKFSSPELKLIIDVFNGTLLTPGMAGQHLLASVTDGIDLDRLGEKWGIDGPVLVEKLKSLTIAQAAAMEVWACGYWQGDYIKSSDSLDNYIEVARL